MSPSPRVEFRVPPELEREIAGRAAYLGGLSGAARTDLARYRALVRRASARLASEGVFSPDEQALILDALNGSLLGARPETLAGSVEDAMALDGLAEKWGVSAAALREKLVSLTPLEYAAVADAAEGFWAAPEGKDVRRGLFGSGGR